MKNIEIWLLEGRPNIKQLVTHIDNGVKIKRLAKPEWRNLVIARGGIRIENEENITYDELFFVDEEFWQLKDFERQWQEGLARIETHDSSCLVETIKSIGNGAFCRRWWVLYKMDNKIRAQFRYAFACDDEKMMGKPFTPETCYSFIPSYETHDGDGEIFEIIVDLE